MKFASSGIDTCKESADRLHVLALAERPRRRVGRRRQCARPVHLAPVGAIVRVASMLLLCRPVQASCAMPLPKDQHHGLSPGRCRARKGTGGAS